MMYPEKISTASTSGIWYQFSISSFQNGTSVAHVAGSISAVASPQRVAGSTSVDATDYDKWTMGRWYEKLANEGLRFGPMFQTLTSMKTEKEKIKPEALSTCKIFQRTPKSSNASFPGTFYAVHPLVVDACLQAAIMGGTAGRLDKLKAFLPIFFKHLLISTPKMEHIEGEAYIHSRSNTTGFATRKINVTLRDKKDQVIVDMSDARLSLYSGKMEEATNPSELNRHPCLRVVWKPDITRLDESQKSELDGYLEQWLSGHHHLTENSTVGIMAGLIDLAGHKNPRIRILELEKDCDCKSKQWLEILDEKTDFPRVREWHSGSFSGNELIISPQGHPGKTNKVKLGAEGALKYDLLLMPRKETTNEHWPYVATDIEKVISPQGIVIGRRSLEAARHLRNSGFRVFSLVGGVMLALAPQKPIKFEDKQVVFVSGLGLMVDGQLLIQAQVERSSSPSTLSVDLQSYFKSKVGEGSVKSYSLEGLARVDLPPKTITISLIELEQPLLATMSPKEMDLLRRVTDKTTDLIWLTGANYMSGSSPDLTLASGLSRALMLEQPSLRFTILDIGANRPRMLQSERNRICANVENALFADDVPGDKEFVVRDSLLHISRFVPDDGLNGRFSQRQNQQPQEMALEEASPAKLAIKTVGNMDTIYFQQESEVEGEIPAGLVDIDVKAVSLNAKVRTRFRALTRLTCIAGYLCALRESRNEKRHICN